MFLLEQLFEYNKDNCKVDCKFYRICLILKPINDKTLGADEKLYTIHVTYEGGSSEPSEVTPPESSSAPSVAPKTQNNNGNPHTGSTATFIISLIMFGSLIFTLRYYSKNVG